MADDWVTQTLCYLLVLGMGTGYGFCLGKLDGFCAGLDYARESDESLRRFCADEEPRA